MKYKLLEPEFTKTGFRFRQLVREGDIAIFHKVHLKGATCPKDVDAGFEVVVIGRHDGYTIGGVQIDPAETMPSNSQWGSRGWTCTNLLDAEKRFERLLKGEIPEDDSDSTPDNEEETPTEPEEPKDKVIPPWPKSLKREEVKFPEGNFTKQEFADFNGIKYSAAHPAIENMIGQEVEYVGKRAKPEGVRGKPSAEYKKKS